MGFGVILSEGLTVHSTPQITQLDSGPSSGGRPFGLVLILSPWNYNLGLSLVPLVAPSLQVRGRLHPHARCLSFSCPQSQEGGGLAPGG